MSLFNIRHAEGIHIIVDVKKHKNHIELKTITGEELFIIAITDESYTVYDDRFAGASKQMNSIEAFQIDGSFRSLDFDNMRKLFTDSFNCLMDELAKFVGTKELADLDAIKRALSKDVKGIYFKIISDTKTYQL